MNEVVSKQTNRGKGLRPVLGFLNDWGIVLAILALVLFFATTAPTFLQGTNLINIFRSISIVTIIAIGLTVSLTVNGFDLSVGSTATLASSFVVSFFVWYSLPIGVSIGLALLLSLSVALVNILLIVWFKIPDLFATLATMFIVEGVAMTYTGGGSISAGMPRLDGTPTVGTIPEAFAKISQAPWIIVIMLVVVAVTHVFLSHTRHGRFLYIIGGNPEAARLTGIRVNRYRALAYLIAGLLAAIGGILLASQVGSSQINAGSGYLMPAVAAAFIGSSFAGQGKPNALGTLVGACLVGILENGLVMLSVPYYSLNIIKGLVLAVALATTYARYRKK
ncbi:sugar ABC transporter permease [Exiguobacterium indicum]|uniref:Sugar ABC transporter permease n=1 Tax=Exiguobacterium indicum TaxID=296995 RepID=A0AAW3M9S1_9BACL|nr:ABC transporter permease [Exiguobacterium indicum]KTR25486.1 sugar ABC transporter permease [Exiguobacterium indicum]